MNQRRQRNPRIHRFAFLLAIVVAALPRQAQTLTVTDDKDARQFLLEARSSAERIKIGLHEMGFRFWLLTDIAKLQAQTGDIAEALKTAESIDSDSHLSDRAEALTAIGLAQSKAGDERGARKSFDLALDSLRQILPGTWTSSFAPMGELAEAQLACGFADEAKVTITLAIAAARDPRESRSGDILARIVKSLVAMGESDWALETARSIGSNQAGHDDALLKVVRARIQSRDVECALRLAREMPVNDSGTRSLALIAVSTMLDEMKDARSDEILQEAREAATTMRDELPRTRTYLELGAAFKRRLQIDKANDCFELALKTAQQAQDIETRYMAIEAIAKAHAAFGDRAVAMGVLKKARADIRTIEDRFETDRALEIVGIALAELDQIDGACEIMQEMKSMNFWENSVREATAKAQARIAQWTAAVATANAITDEMQRGSALRAIAKAQTAANDLDGVKKWLSKIPRATAVYPTDRDDEGALRKWWDEQILVIARCQTLMGMAEGLLERATPRASSHSQ